MKEIQINFLQINEINNQPCHLGPEGRRKIMLGINHMLDTTRCSQTLYPFLIQQNWETDLIPNLMTGKWKLKKVSVITQLQVMGSALKFRFLWFLGQFTYLYTIVFVKWKVTVEIVSKVSFRLLETRFDDAIGAILVLLSKQVI